MDPKEGERVVVSKPVASRPSYSNFRSFSELLSGAINSSPPNSSSEITAPAIRPKTIRLKPTPAHHPPTGLISSQAAISESADADNTDSESNKSAVVFKPQAKLVSRRTVSLLANMGNFSPNSPNNRQQTPHHTVPQTTNASIESSKIVEEDPKSLQHPMAHCDRPSYDGYNWRKYGQKQVKGSEYPRSYYKCTHPNCPVKKKVERSLDGQIAEIVYKGEHNHSKPQPPNRNSSVLQGTGLGLDGVGQETNNNPVWSNFPNEKNDGSEGRIENRNEVGSSNPEKATLPYESVLENSCGVRGECEEPHGKGAEVEEDEPRSKRRKGENHNQSSEAGISGEGVEPRIIVQNSNDSEILGDGFRWRKYGQKVVKGNPYPRSYYRCTSPKCNVRKHVERASDDPKAFITTYEGKHNHDMPTTKNTHPPVAGSEMDSKAQSSKHRQ